MPLTVERASKGIPLEFLSEKLPVFVRRKAWREAAPNIPPRIEKARTTPLSEIGSHLQVGNGIFFSMQRSELVAGARPSFILMKTIEASRLLAIQLLLRNRGHWLVLEAGPLSCGLFVATNP